MACAFNSWGIAMAVTHNHKAINIFLRIVSGLTGIA